MPYTKYATTRNGKKVFCMKNISTGKKYCYKSKADRKEGMRLHEAYSHGFKQTK